MQRCFWNGNTDGCNGQVIEKMSPVTNLKSIKNSAEIEGMKQAHLKDAVQIYPISALLPQTRQTRAVFGLFPGASARDPACFWQNLSCLARFQVAVCSFLSWLERASEENQELDEVISRLFSSDLERLGGSSPVSGRQTAGNSRKHVEFVLNRRHLACFAAGFGGHEARRAAPRAGGVRAHEP